MQSAVFSIAAGTSKTSQVITATLLDAVGNLIGPLAGVATEHGDGAYSFFATQLPDGFQGTVRFYGRPASDDTATPAFLAATTLNPDEQAVPSLNVAVTSLIPVVRGDDYTGERAIVLSNQTWPDLTQGGVVQLHAHLGDTYLFDQVLDVTGPHTVTLSLTSIATGALQAARYAGTVTLTTQDGQITLDYVVLDATAPAPSA